MAARGAGLPVAGRIVAGAGTAFGLRWAAWTNHLVLPTWGNEEGQEEGQEEGHEEGHEKGAVGVGGGR